jgi:hypothetical protein
VQRCAWRVSGTCFVGRCLSTAVGSLSFRFTCFGRETWSVTLREERVEGVKSVCTKRSSRTRDKFTGNFICGFQKLNMKLPKRGGEGDAGSA